MVCGMTFSCYSNILTFRGGHTIRLTQIALHRVPQKFQIYIAPQHKIFPSKILEAILCMVTTEWRLKNYSTGLGDRNLARGRMKCNLSLKKKSNKVEARFEVRRGKARKYVM